MRVFRLVLIYILALCFVSAVGCGDGELAHTHIYNRQVISEQYLSSNATCKQKAKYFYACECGKKGSESFEYGDFAEHTYQVDWGFSEDVHFKKAICGCDVEVNEQEHDNDGGICSICQYPIEPSDDVTYVKSTDGKSAEVTGYTGKASVIKIAPTFMGLPVKKIAETAFSAKENLKHIIIADSVEVVSSSVFTDCVNLQSVVFGANVLSIGSNCFRDCENLESITIGDNLTTIETGAFFNCKKLDNVVLPKSLTEIGTWAFFTCESLTKVFYKGTKADWEKVVIGANNYEIINVTKYFYLENGQDLPQDNGNYWHYVNGIPTIW